MELHVADYDENLITSSVQIAEEAKAAKLRRIAYLRNQIENIQMSYANSEVELLRHMQEVREVIQQNERTEKIVKEENKVLKEHNDHLLLRKISLQEDLAHVNAEIAASAKKLLSQTPVCQKRMHLMQLLFEQQSTHKGG